MKRLLPFALILSAVPAFSQGLEVSASSGYTTAGGLEPKAAGVTDLKLKDAFTWGASASFFFSPRFGVEGSWARQESALEIGTAAGSAEMFDVHVDQLLGSFVFQLGNAESALRPFLSAGAGAALFSAPNLDGETKLAFNLGAGLKWLPSRRFGARFQARYTPAYLHDASSDFCDPFGFCKDWLHQFELTGGVVVRF